MQVNFKLSTPFKAYVVDVIPTDTRLIDNQFLINKVDRRYICSSEAKDFTEQYIVYRPDTSTQAMLFVQLSSKMLVYQRRSYNVLDFFGALGGFIKMIMYLVNILIAGYGITHFKVHMVVSAFRRRDRTLTLQRHLWSKPLSTGTLSQLSFQLMTSTLKVSNSFGLKSCLLNLLGNQSL